ncbi:hypothetical protein OLE50_10815, partial [Streptococcus pneumoniae]|nr:hypothetical protein [Streptococcus pneumoniae]
RNHPGSKLRQGFWMVFRLGVNNWGRYINENLPQGRFFASRKAIDRNCWTLKKMKFCSKELFKLKRAIISSNLFQKKNG